MIPVPSANALEKFDLKQFSTFIYKSLSEETRRSYKRVIAEFFAFVGNVQPPEVKPADFLSFRDSLIHKRLRPATVAFKLSVIRSLFDYLKAHEIVLRNPAETKLVAVPALAEDLRGRALTLKEVRCLLSEPDTKKAEGAGDYAIMLLLLRTSMRVAERLFFEEIINAMDKLVLNIKVQSQRRPRADHSFETAEKKLFTLHNSFW